LGSRLIESYVAGLLGLRVGCGLAWAIQQIEKKEDGMIKKGSISEHFIVKSGRGY